MAPHPSLIPNASSTPADQGSSATSKAGTCNFMADSYDTSKAGACTFMEGRSSMSQAGACTFMPDSVPYVRARQGNSCFFGSPPSSPSYLEGYRALYEGDDLNLSVLYRSMMAPSPEHAPPQ